MIAPSDKLAQGKSKTSSVKIFVVLAGLSVAVAVFWAFRFIGTDDPREEMPEELHREALDVARHSKRETEQPRISTRHGPTPPGVADSPKTNQWGNPVRWGRKKLRPAMVHRIDRSRLPLFEQVFPNRADRAIAGLLVIEPGTDLIGEEIFDESFVRAFLKSIESPIIVTREDSDETKALKRAVIDTKIDLKSRLDAGEDIAKMLTDIRRELRELGAYREDLKKLIEEKSRDHGMSAEDMKDFVEAANIMLDERGAKPIVMPEFYYRQLEIKNQKIKALKGE